MEDLMRESNSIVNQTYRNMYQEEYLTLSSYSKHYSLYDKKKKKQIKKIKFLKIISHNLFAYDRVLLFDEILLNNSMLCHTL